MGWDFGKFIGLGPEEPKKADAPYEQPLGYKVALAVNSAASKAWDWTADSAVWIANNKVESAKIAGRNIRDLAVFSFSDEHKERRQGVTTQGAVSAASDGVGLIGDAVAWSFVGGLNRGVALINRGFGEKEKISDFKYDWGTLAGFMNKHDKIVDYIPRPGDSGLADKFRQSFPTLVEWDNKGIAAVNRLGAAVNSAYAAVGLDALGLKVDKVKTYDERMAALAVAFAPVQAVGTDGKANQYANAERVFLYGSQALAGIPVGGWAAAPVVATTNVLRTAVTAQKVVQVGKAAEEAAAALTAVKATAEAAKAGAQTATTQGAKAAATAGNTATETTAAAQAAGTAKNTATQTANAGTAGAGGGSGGGTAVLTRPPAPTPAPPPPGMTPPATPPPGIPTSPLSPANAAAKRAVDQSVTDAETAALMARMRNPNYKPGGPTSPTPAAPHPTATTPAPHPPTPAPAPAAAPKPPPQMQARTVVDAHHDSIAKKAAELATRIAAQKAKVEEAKAALEAAKAAKASGNATGKAADKAIRTAEAKLQKAEKRLEPLVTRNVEHLERTAAAMPAYMGVAMTGMTSTGRVSNMYNGWQMWTHGVGRTFDFRFDGNIAKAFQVGFAGLSTVTGAHADKEKGAETVAGAKAMSLEGQQAADTGDDADLRAATGDNTAGEKSVFEVSLSELSNAAFSGQTDSPPAAAPPESPAVEEKSVFEASLTELSAAAFNGSSATNSGAASDVTSSGGPTALAFNNRSTGVVVPTLRGFRTINPKTVPEALRNSKPA